MKQILCLMDWPEHSEQTLEFAALAASKIQGNLLLYEWSHNPSKELLRREDCFAKFAAARNSTILNIVDGLSGKYQIATAFDNPTFPGETDQKRLGRLATASEAVVVDSRHADRLLKILSNHPEWLFMQCPVIVVPEIFQPFEPTQLIYLHKTHVNPWTEMVLPAWWSQLLGITFSIWTEPEELDRLKGSKKRDFSDFLQQVQHEKIISSVGEHADPEPDKTEPGTIYALAFNPQQHDGEDYLNRFMQKSVNPILVFDVG